jgi:hypothetical protein
VAEKEMTKRRLITLGSLFIVTAALPLGAQTVRGNVIDESTKLPIGEVLISLVAPNGAVVKTGVRSDSIGAFVIHAAEAGTFRVSAARIGYRALQSDPIELRLGQIAVVRLRMTTLAQQLVPVTVVERRALKLDELMSEAGFDLRQAKGVGRFMNAEQLAEFGVEGTGEVLRSQLRPNVEVDDNGEGPYIWMRRGAEQCAPEIYLDGARMSGPGDALFKRQSAFAMLEAVPAKELHGVEVYRGYQIPPPSLGGMLGIEQGAIRPCGVVAVWTKWGAIRRNLAARRGGKSDDVQVIRGVIVDFDTGKPVPGVPITLLNETRSDLGQPVRSDSTGEFIIRTNRFGTVRLGAGSIGYNPAFTPVFTLDPRELVLVRLFVSATKPVLAPLGIAARFRPESFAITATGGFIYRRERGIGGTFFRADQLERTGAATLVDVLRRIDGVVVAGSAPATAISMRTPEKSGVTSCAPTLLVDGLRVAPPAVDSTLATMPLSRVSGLEVYTTSESLPEVFVDIGGACGLIGVWSRKQD